MHKKLALVLLEPECSSWQSPSPHKEVPPWSDLPPALPWTAAMAFADAWMRYVLGLMSWFNIPANRG